MNSSIIPLIENNVTFSPYYFYNDFIKKVADFYQNHEKGEKIQFRLALDSDFDFVGKNFFIDPISLPLLLSLSLQLKNYHKSPLPLFLSNNYGTVNILEFLYRSDFFHLVGDNKNPTFPLGKNIFDYNDAYLGGFKGQGQRIEHKIRCYSLLDDNLQLKLNNILDEEAQRDFLVEHYTYKVKEHYGILLNENDNTGNYTNDFVEILAELITNGVLHSKSDTFSLMFSDKYKTKFSISDSGIGLYDSLDKKNNNHFYKKFVLLNSLSKTFNLKVSEHIKLSLLAIFETLFYSMLKDRKGLFDLMCNVVINCGGYFRLHNNNAQVIISSRMLNDIQVLYETRALILNTHNAILFGQIPEKDFIIKMQELEAKSRQQIIQLATSIFKKFSIDVKFSSIRLFEVKFRGVHIEVEIPNSNNTQ